MLELLSWDFLFCEEIPAMINFTGLCVCKSRLRLAYHPDMGLWWSCPACFPHLDYCNDVCLKCRSELKGLYIRETDVLLENCLKCLPIENGDRLD